MTQTQTFLGGAGGGVGATAAAGVGATAAAGLGATAAAGVAEGAGAAGVGAAAAGALPPAPPGIDLWISFVSFIYIHTHTHKLTHNLSCPWGT